MADIGARFKLYGKTAAAWTSANPTPLARELCVETDTGKAKLGDGTTAWNSLPYWTLGGVSSFNTRTGAVTLSSGDVTTALGFTPGSVIAQSAVAVPHTGTTAETTLATITIPANAMGANGRIELDVIWSYTNSANTKTLRQKFGGTTILSTAVGASAVTRTSAVIANRNATNSQVATPNFSTSFGVSSATLTTMAIDTTAAVNIVLTAQLANSGETITLEAYSVKLFK